MSLTLGTTEGEKTEAVCSLCSRKTNHEVLQAASLTVNRDDIDFVSADYEVIQCQGCDEISFRQVDHYYYGDTGERVEALYPPRLAGRPIIREAYYISEKVRALYSETHSALCAGLPVLTAVGIRAVIEAVAKEKGLGGGNLKELIEGLAANGFLSLEDERLVHDLRFMGNEAAHEVNAEDVQTLSDAMDVVEHLMQSAYIFPAKKEDRDQARRRARNQQNS